jgi:hypothetical protein
VGVHQIVSFTVFVKRQQIFSVRRRMVEGVPVQVDRRLVREKVVSKFTRQVPGRASVYDRLARYFKEMGIAEEINPLMRATAPESMHWMTRDEMVRTRLVTDAIAADQIIGEGNMALRPAALLPAELTANIRVDGGRFQDEDISLIVRFTWMRGAGSIIVAATAIRPFSVKGITVAPVEYNVTLRPGKAQERALIPRPSESAPTLYGHMTRAEFCQLRQDPLLRVAILPGALEGVQPRTIYVGAGRPDGMGPLIDGACRNVEMAAAGP